MADADTFIAVAFPDDQMQILPYNRTVKDLGRADAGRVPRRAPPARSGSRTARRRHGARARCRCIWPVAGTPSISPAAVLQTIRARAVLDVALLQRHVLEQLLSIGDIRTDKRIDFVGGARGTEALERAVDSGGAAVAFSMYPVTVDDLMAISDDGGIMPPKSTWFEPKLRDGLLVHLI